MFPTATATAIFKQMSSISVVVGLINLQHVSLVGFNFTRWLVRTLVMVRCSLLRHGGLSNEVAPSPFHVPEIPESGRTTFGVFLFSCGLCGLKESLTRRGLNPSNVRLTGVIFVISMAFTSARRPQPTPTTPTPWTDPAPSVRSWLGCFIALNSHG